MTIRENHLLIAIALIVCFITFCAMVPGERKSAGAPASRTGAPIFMTANEGTCYSGGCHGSFGLNTGAGILDIECVNCYGQYIAGEQHTIRVTISEPGFDKFGFQSVVLRNDSNLQAGAVALVDAINTQIIGANSPSLYLKNRKYVTHTFDGAANTGTNTSQWEYTWTAPANYTDSITIYASAISANGDLETFGDYVYTASLSLTGILVGSSMIPPEEEALLFPNPVRGILQVAALNKPCQLRITSISGALMWQQVVSGIETINISSELRPGVYLYSLERKGLLLGSGKLIIN